MLATLEPRGIENQTALNWKKKTSLISVIVNTWKYARSIQRLTRNDFFIKGRHLVFYIVLQFTCNTASPFLLQNQQAKSIKTVLELKKSRRRYKTKKRKMADFYLITNCLYYRQNATIK